MSASDKYAELFQRFLPGPFAIAIILTVMTFVLAFFFTDAEVTALNRTVNLISYWESGLWERSLLVFAFQMMLMLILGHVLALTAPVAKLIDFMLKFCTNTARSAFLVTLLTVLVSLFNWGLGLIFGAIFARKVGENAKYRNTPLNYPMIGAAGYSGLMVWHGGISGSSLVKVAEKGHLRDLMSGIYGPRELSLLPDAISFDQTVFGPMNLAVMVVLVLVLPAAMYFIAGRSGQRPFEIKSSRESKLTGLEKISGADRLNHSRWVAYLFALLVFLGVLIRMTSSTSLIGFSFITPDFINLVLLFFCILLHGNFHRFICAVDEAIIGAAGILIQFPLYFGIMGLMKGSGMVEVISNFFISVSNEFSFPIFTYFSAGLVNIFVPSGGGQWAVQGPIIIQTAENMHVPLSKCIMALAYGDQLTNMLQPFWALPLLGITGLKAKEILPYTILLMVIGFVIFLTALLVY